MNFEFESKKFEGCKEKYAIVVVGYNRIDSLLRLLYSLEKAEYPAGDIPLVISLDYGGGDAIRMAVEEFNWTHGQKICIFHEENLKLKKHMFSCMSLTEFFKGIILLEDDIFVSPVFYYYAQSAMEYYGNNDKVAGISLYNTSVSNFSHKPLYIMRGQSDVYAAQMVETWGECFTYNMWNSFNEWYEENPNINWEQIDMYPFIGKWKNAWSKFYFAWMLSTRRFFIEPYCSLSTCFSDAGVHSSNGLPSNTQQEILQYHKKEFEFEILEKLYQYDVYFNPLGLGRYLGVKDEDLVVDFYQDRQPTNKRFLLTCAILDYKIVKSYDLRLKPIESNIIERLDGERLFLYDRSVTEKNNRSKRAANKYLMDYYFDGLQTFKFHKYVFKYSMNWFYERAVHKFKKILNKKK